MGMHASHIIEWQKPNFDNQDVGIRLALNKVVIVIFFSGGIIICPYRLQHMMLFFLAQTKMSWRTLLTSQYSR